jgi:SAM-dependent methyltransferase
MGYLHHHIADNRNPRSLAARMRRRRFALFCALLEGPPKAASVLDVGGTLEFWQAMGDIPPGLTVTLLNRNAQSRSLPQGFRAVTGDARALTDFAPGAFDVVFSNSVIEHVGGFDDQRRMAAEVRRVGKRYFVQTPNRWFPIEPHFLLPYFQFYPQPLQVALTQHFALGWYPRIPEREQAMRHVELHRLLTAGELRSLFPDARIHRERFAGLTKSLIAIGPHARV